MGRNRKTARLIKTGFALLMVVSMAGCGIPRDTLHSSFPVFLRGPVPTVTPPSSNLSGGLTSTWSATWVVGTGSDRYTPETRDSPYTVTWNFGGAAENIGPIEVTSPATAETTWVSSAQTETYSWTVTVTDSLGQSGSDSGLITIAPRPNTPPVIEDIDTTWQEIRVRVSDADGDPVTVSLVEFSGFSADSDSKEADGEGLVVFHTAADNIFGGGTSDVTITADDGWGGTTSETIHYDFIIEWIVPETLYAIPLAEEVAVGEPVTVVVATGPTGHSFQFMTGVGVTMPDDARYVLGTFNHGLPGGEKLDADGAWATITSDGGFLLPLDLIQPGPDPDGSLPAGYVRYDFNITPLGGQDVAAAEGALFNLQFTFSEPGEKTIGFQQFNGVNRTYYSNLADGIDRFWGSFIEGTITVIE